MQLLLMYVWILTCLQDSNECKNENRRIEDQDADYCGYNLLGTQMCNSASARDDGIESKLGE